MVQSRHIEVNATTPVTFKAEMGGKRTVSFTTPRGVEEEWIYRSHHSSIYFILRDAFDIKGVETASGALDKDGNVGEDKDIFHFTKSKYPPNVMTNLAEDTDNLQVRPLHYLTISPFHHFTVSPSHHHLISLLPHHLHPAKPHCCTLPPYPPFVIKI